MILESLYNINDVQTAENNTIQAKLDLNVLHDIFQGHFPGHPVVPGVCLTNMITDTISASLGKSYYLFSADFIKFIRLVVPSETPSVYILVKILAQNENSVKAEAQLFFENVVFLKLKGDFRLVVGG